MDARSIAGNKVVLGVSRSRLVVTAEDIEKKDERKMKERWMHGKGGSRG